MYVAGDSPSSEFIALGAFSRRKWLFMECRIPCRSTASTAGQSRRVALKCSRMARVDWNRFPGR